VARRLDVDVAGSRVSAALETETRALDWVGAAALTGIRLPTAVLAGSPPSPRRADIAIIASACGTLRARAVLSEYLRLSLEGSTGSCART